MKTWSWYCGKRGGERGVVRRLLDFARQSESARVRSDINEIVLDVLALVNHLLRISGIQLFTDLAEGLPWISVDRNQIKQVMLNLVHNALHAMPTGGEIHITTNRRQRDNRQWLAMCLADTGTGIAPENLARVFEPFFTTVEGWRYRVGPVCHVWDHLRSWRRYRC